MLMCLNALKIQMSFYKLHYFLCLFDGNNFSNNATSNFKKMYLMYYYSGHETESYRDRKD